MKALLTGTIANLGSQYVVTLTVTNAATGDTLAEVQEQAGRKEEVLSALGRGVSKLRGRLGESLGSVQRFDKPLDQVTTSSLEALKVYVAAREKHLGLDQQAAIPLYRRAIEVDPNFAMAYASLAAVYGNFGYAQQAEETYRRAFELRERTSERERLLISGGYYSVRGNVPRAVEAYELYRQIYPRDALPYTNLGFMYDNYTGEFQKALEVARQALRLAPDSYLEYSNLAGLYSELGRWDEAKAVELEAQKKNLGGFRLHMELGGLAFIQGDTATGEKEWVTAASLPGGEDVDWGRRARLLAQGKVRAWRELSVQVLAREQSTNGAEAAANMIAQEAHLEAILEYTQRSADATRRALAFSRAFQVLQTVAFARAISRDEKQAEALMAEVVEQRPEDTLLKIVYQPHLRAIVALNGGKPNKALELLKPAAAYDGNRLWVRYTRAQAYLAAGQTQDALHEFETILARKDVAPFDLVWPMAKLGSAAAYAAAGDKANARNAYQDFFALWKDADPDIPIYQRAKAEYAKLK